MTRARDLADSADKDISGTLTLDGLVVDDITIDGSTISDGGDFTIDSGGEISLDADGGVIRFKDGGSDIGLFSIGGTDFTIRSLVSDRDIIFKGNDGGSTITALTLDMSAAGDATFNNNVKAGNSVGVSGSAGMPVLQQAAASASFPSYSFYDDGNTGMFRPSADALAFATGGTERLRITSGGDVLSGKTTSDFNTQGNNLKAGGHFVFDGNSALYLNRLSSDGSILSLYKDGSLIGSLDVDNSDNLTIQGNSSHSGLQFGTNAIFPHKNGANIDATIDLGESSLRWKDLYLSGVVYVADTTGNPVGNHNPGIMLHPANGSHFHRDGGNPVRVGTSVDGNLTEYYKEGALKGFIAVNGNDFIISGPSAVSGIAFNSNGLLPALGGTVSDNTEDIGQADLRYDDIHATNGTIQTSDRNEKQDIAELTDAEQRVAVAAKGLLRKFRWKDKVAEKGDKARTHFGIIAQDLQAAFEAEGLDAGDYAMFISSTWTDEETGEERTRMGVRYSELLAFIIAAI